jgi:DNA-binding transcriptional ArsR family regulator
MVRPSTGEDVFRAVADPTRRAVLEVLGRDGEQPVSALAGRLDVSVPLLSRHLAVLRSASLVTERRAGRQRLYRLCPGPLRELYDWAAVFADFWPERVRRLHAYLEKTGADHGARDHR